MGAPKQEDLRLLRAERAFKRQAEGALAMWEYQAQGRAARANTVRLRAQRLAKEAQDDQAKSGVAAASHTVLPHKNVKRSVRAAPMEAPAKAAQMASQAIDRLGDRSATREECANRKRRLLKGPKEFRDIRDDLPE